ncbi:MAG: aminoacyl-tRNA deacylase, partial [Chloroflexota bacterium]
SFLHPMSTLLKTLAMKVLEGKKIPYEVLAYPDQLRDAEAIAATLGLPAGQLFKTLVVARPPAKPLLAMVPADRQLNLKKLAAATGDKKLKMATHREAEELTGLRVGGISALALLNKGFVILLDQSAQTHEHLYVSAGQPGLDLKVATAALVKVTNARLVDVCDHETPKQPV